MKLLAIDDNQDNLTTLRAVVEDILPECELLTSLSGPAGIELARSADPDAILLDIVMPGMDGFEVCRRLKADTRLRSIPVVFLTATRTDRESRVKALDAGAEAFLSKPLDGQELLAQIRAMAKIKAANRLQRLETDQLAALVAERTRELEQELAERKRAEAAVAQMAQEWQDTFDAMGEAVWILDAEMRVLRTNRAAERSFHLPCPQMLGRHCWEIVHGTAEPVPSCPVARLRQSLRHESVELQIGEGWFEVVVDPILAADGQLAGVVHVVTDISARKLAEREREALQAHYLQAQKMELVGRLAGGVAHDFNNLLMGIMGYAELGQDVLPPEHPVRGYLDEITHDAQRTADITRQLLAFARKQTVAPEVLDLNEALAGTLGLLRRLVGESIDLAWLPGANLWPLKIDPTQVDQVLVDLCANARDAIDGTGQITVETANATLGPADVSRYDGAVPGDYVLLQVSDDGCGMSEDTLAHLFEPFFTTKGVGKGTGLGLATVDGIVKQNGGFIGVDSEPGQGTTFRIYLPRCAERAAASNVIGREAVPHGHGETILLVEDEKSLRVTCGLFLQALGYSVLAAETPTVALSLAAEHAGVVQLVLTDVVMPGMDGRHLVQRLSALVPGLRVLFMSGYTADVVAHHGVLDEGVHFIGKPFTRDDLARKVRQVLDA